MKTDELIAVLAADTRPQPGVGARLAKALPGAVGLSVVAFALFWGLRAELGQALGSVAVFKSLLPLVLAMLAAWLAVGVAHPGEHPSAQAAALAAFGAALVLVLAVALGRAGFGALGAALATPSLMVCLTSIPVLALPLLAAALWALRGGAPIHPARAGAVAGLAAGGLAAAMYSLYCDQDALLFYLPAYGLAVLGVAAAGAAAGARLLRW